MLTDEEIDEVVDWQLKKQKPYIRRQLFDVIEDFPDVLTGDRADWPVPHRDHDLDIWDEANRQLTNNNQELIDRLMEVSHA